MSSKLGYEIVELPPHPQGFEIRQIDARPNQLSRRIFLGFLSLSLAGAGLWLLEQKMKAFPRFSLYPEGIGSEDEKTEMSPSLQGDFSPPQEVPFTTIKWRGSPRRASFSQDQWPSVRRWAGLVEKESENQFVGKQSLRAHLASNGFDLNVVLAQMWIESGGNPHARNRTSDATGLMQVMPCDGKAASYGVFSDRPTIEQLLDPKKNIRWGMKILSGNIARSESIPLGFERYYGGTGNSGYWDMTHWLYRQITAS